MPGRSLPHKPILKIGFVVDDSLDPPDGVQQYVLALGRWFGSRGHDVHYLTSTTTRRDVPNVHTLAQNVRVNFDGNRHGLPLLASKQAIRSLLDKVHFDVLHVQMPYSPLLAGEVIRQAAADTAVVGTFHVVPRTRLFGSLAHLLRLACSGTLKRFDSVVSVSGPAQAFARSAFGLTSEVVPNTVDLDRFRQAAPLFSADARGPVVLFLGRLVPRKGCLTLLQAVELLKHDPSVKPFSVIVCGDGPLLDGLRRFARNRGLSDIVTFEGFISEADKPRYYTSADITVFPSTGGESFGIVLVEAMASGAAAVIAGGNAGYRSVLGDCPGDVLFDPLDPAALAGRLRTLLSDRDMREHIAAWQRQHAERFGIERIGGQVEQLYLSALHHRRSMQ